MGDVFPRGPVDTCGADLGCHKDYQHYQQVVRNNPWAQNNLSLHTNLTSISPLLFHCKPHHRPPISREVPHHRGHTRYSGFYLLVQVSTFRGVTTPMALGTAKGHSETTALNSVVLAVKEKLAPGPTVEGEPRGKGGLAPMGEV